MADPAFAEMEAEAESFVPQVRARLPYADRCNDEHEEAEVRREESNPLLGPPVLSRQPDKRWYNTPSVFWLLPAFVLTALSFGATMAPKINLYYSLVCEDYYSERGGSGLPGPLPGGAYPVIEIGQSHPDCRIPEIQARASRLALAINLCTGLISAVTAGRYGALSDRIGRRPVILIALCGTVLNDCIVILMTKFWKYLGIEFFLVGAILDGMFGSFTTTMAATNAYVTDCSTPDRRAISFAYIQSVFFLGIAAGPILGGILINRSGSAVTLFYCALAVHLSFALYILLLIPESVTTEHALRARQNHNNRRLSAEGVPFHPRQWRYWSNLLNIFQPLGIFWPRGGRGRQFKLKRRNLLILGMVDGILLLNIGAFAVIILYPIYMFNWGDLESGYYLSIVGSVRSFVLLIVLPIIIRVVRGPPSRTPPTITVGADNLEVWLIRLCPFIEMCGFMLMSFAKTTNQYYAGGAFTALGGIGPPTLHSALTKHVAKEEVGRLLGALSTIGAMSRVVSPMVLNLLYSFTVATCPQTIFYLLTGAMGIAFIMSCGLRAHVRVDGDDNEDEPEDS